MGHVNTVIELLKRKAAQSTPTATTSSKAYDLPGLKDFSGPTPDQVIMYKKEYNLLLESKRKYEAELLKRSVKGEDRRQTKAALRDTMKSLEQFAAKIGPLKPLEIMHGFPEVRDNAK